jgi:DNA-binding MarR family transcriptional regulator
MTDRTRVLVHLFRDGQHRNVVALARALRMDQSAVKHRLDQLVGAKLARLKIVQGHLYWGITNEGRRYVIERERDLGIISPETVGADPQPQRLLITQPVE